MKKLLFIFLISFQTICLSDNQKLYPFQDKPTLPWTEFEKDFRKKYAHLDIPEIYLVKTGQAQYHNEHKIILFDPSYFAKSTPLAEMMLLHEIGHHHYDQKLREQNHKLGIQLAANAHTKTISTLNMTEKALILSNVWHIACKGPNIRLLLAQGFMTALLASSEKIHSMYMSTIGVTYAVKPEEIFADNFANNHASQEALKAGIHMFSKKGFKEYIQKQNEEITEKTLQDLRDRNKPESTVKRFELFAKSMNQISNKTISIQYTLNNLLSFKHPKPIEREKTAQQALKERFNK